MDDRRERKIIHVDMDAFFAAIEQKRHPELKGKPVVVGGRGNPFSRGVVSAASYEARAYGIRSAMPLREAYRRCPQAIFLPVDFEEYEKVSSKIMDILKTYTEILEPVSLDEAFLDVTHIDRSPVEIARDIKRRIREETGLTASIGIGPNKLIAKIASDMDKPDGLTEIKKEDIPDRIFPLPVSRLWGVGKKTEKKLHEMGIYTIGDLARAPLDTLIHTFGKATGYSLYQHAHGIDYSPVITTWERKSISREVTYQRDTENMELIKDTIKHLARDIWISLKEEGYQGKTVTVKIRFKDFTTHTRSKTVPYFISSTQEIIGISYELLTRFNWDRKVRLVGVRVSNLIKERKRAKNSHLSSKV